MCHYSYRTRVRLWKPLSLTNCRLVDFIDVTLACEVANSKLVEVVTVVYVSDEYRVDNSCRF